MNAPLPELIACEYCKKMIYPGRNRKRKFCNAAEKQAAYNDRKRAAAQAVTVTSDRQSAESVTSATPGRA